MTSVLANCVHFTWMVIMLFRKQQGSTYLLSTLEDIIDNVVGILNDNGGFTFIGCYKRGEINDQSNKYNFGGTKMVESGEIGYYVVHMYPKNWNVDEYRISKFNIYLLNELAIDHSK